MKKSLENKTQEVTYVTLSLSAVALGVPQGTKLGPLLHNVIFKEVPNEKYLCVTMNTRLSWKKHINEVVANLVK